MAALAMTEAQPFHAIGRALLSERKRLLDELRNAASTIEAREACANLLLSGEPAIDNLRVAQVVEACRGVGPGRAKLLLVVSSVDGNMRVGDILARDALRLAATLRGER